MKKIIFPGSIIPNTNNQVVYNTIYTDSSRIHSVLRQHSYMRPYTQGQVDFLLKKKNIADTKNSIHSFYNFRAFTFKDRLKKLTEKYLIGQIFAYKLIQNLTILRIIPNKFDIFCITYIE